MRMGKRVGQIGRRAALSVLASLPFTARRALAEAAARYSIAVSPVNALLGDRIRLVLGCRTSRPGSITAFEDASLALAMARRSSRVEPELHFPNRKTVQEGGRLLRLGRAVRRDVQPSERVEKEFDLVSTFPRLALDAGEFTLKYEIDDAGQPRRVGPTSLIIESDPEAIPRLLDLLSHEDADARERAAGLVHRMTARVVGYAPAAEAGERTVAISRWKEWWEKTGSKLTWNFRSTGATFGEASSPAPHNRRSRMVGGIAYRRQTLSPADVRTLSSVLTDWLRTPTQGFSALRGTARVADQVLAYPPDDTMLEANGDVVRLLASVLSSSARAASSQPDARAAMLILATVAKMPDRRFVAALGEVRDSLSKGPGWNAVEAAVDGLLDVLDPSRVPVGDEP